jgi:hypothetical protein
MQEEETTAGPLTWSEYAEGVGPDLIPRPKHGLTFG